MGILGEACRVASVLECIENYSTADDPLVTSDPNAVPDGGADEKHRFNYQDYLFNYNDQGFWIEVFRRNDRCWDASVQFDICFVSEWVARVPGLYWKTESAALREVSPNCIESQSEDWITYDPPGKSQKVLGGIGTLRFPPDSFGRRLISLTCGLNASSGVPALVTPDIWDQLSNSSQADGRMLSGLMSHWRPMSTEWAERFPSIRGIPKGYVVLDAQSRLTISENHGPVRFAPFTVMEYVSEDTRRYDFVYASADLGDRNWRRSIEDFFEGYKSRNGRSGTYLLSADMANPLWDSEYRSPVEMRPNLSLIEKRIRKRLEGADVVDQVIVALGKTVHSGNELHRLSDQIGVPSALWATDGPIAQQIASFVAEVIRQTGKIEELLQQLLFEHPGLRDA
jgi:hypothetical protein